LEGAAVEGVKIDDEGQAVVAVRPHHPERDRCGVCGRRALGFDLGEGRRRWRALDLGATLAFLEADAPRVKCPEHGVVVCAVPWARHGSRFTAAFEQQVAWPAVNTSGSAVAELMRISWRSVGRICERVAVEAGRDIDLLAGLRRLPCRGGGRTDRPSGGGRLRRDRPARRGPRPAPARHRPSRRRPYR